MDMQLTAQLRSAPAEVLESIAASHLASIEPDAIVLDANLKLPRGHLQSDFHATGPCVLGDVVQNFLEHGKYIPAKVE